MTMVRVFICDDHQDVRDAVRHAIASIPGFTVSGEAGTGPDCLRELRALPADLVILDVRLPGGGPGLASALRREHPTTTIVVFSALEDPQVQDVMRRAGAQAYVVKTGRLAPLRAALLRHSPAR
jgi:DNA-binding NarL/FixJ family response regulator